MALRKKHYVSIAAILAGQREQATPKNREDEIAKTCINSTLDLIAFGLADYFAAENPEFQRSRFIDACVVEPPKQRLWHCPNCGEHLTPKQVQTHHC
jgi:hypothetical protein